MKEYSLLDEIKDKLWSNHVRAIEYYFAKRWLDKNFGEQEYWGDYLYEKLYPTKNGDIVEGELV